MPKHDTTDLLSARFIAEQQLNLAADSLYDANQKLAQALLIQHGINPDLPITDGFPKTYEHGGYNVTIFPNDTPGEFDVDVRIAALRPAAGRVG